MIPVRALVFNLVLILLAPLGARGADLVLWRENWSAERESAVR